MQVICPQKHKFDWPKSKVPTFCPECGCINVKQCTDPFTVYYTIRYSVKVDATTVADAISQVEDMNIPELDNHIYVDDSFEILYVENQYGEEVE